MRSINRNVVALLSLVTIMACSGRDGDKEEVSIPGVKIPTPSETDVRPELAHFAQVLAQKKILVGPALAEAKVLDIGHEKNSPVAIVSLEAPSDNEQSLQLLFRRSETGWKIYDRDLKDKSSSTYLAYKALEAVQE